MKSKPLESWEMPGADNKFREKRISNIKADADKKL